MSHLKALYTKYREMISYLFWGVMTTAVSWITYTLFIQLLQGVEWETVIAGRTFSLSILTANGLSWICAVAFAFVTNKLWVFQSKSWDRSIVWPEAVKFVASRLATGILEIVAVPLLVGVGLDQTILGIEGMAAKVIVSVVVIILNYILSKFFIFRDKE